MIECYIIDEDQSHIVLART